MGLQSSVNQTIGSIASIPGAAKPDENAYANELLKEAQRKRQMAQRAAFDKSKDRADYTRQRLQRAKDYQQTLGGKK